MTGDEHFMKKSMKRVLIGLFVGAIGVALFAYLRPVEIRSTASGVVYSFEDDFEKETTIVLTGTLHKDLFQGNVFLGNVVVDGDIGYSIMFKDQGTHYFNVVAASSGSSTSTVGNVHASDDFRDIWLKLDAIDERYGIDGYAFGPAEHRGEANERIKDLFFRSKGAWYE